MGNEDSIITSPILSESDWEALEMGSKARIDPMLRSVLARNLKELEEVLPKDTLSALAWMVADEILTFKLALPQNKLAGRDFHDKFGIFSDKEGNQVSFSGSPNESIRGTQNYESIKIFNSWEETVASFVAADVNRFERLRDNEDPNVRVYELPEAMRARF